VQGKAVLTPMLSSLFLMSPGSGFDSYTAITGSVLSSVKVPLRATGAGKDTSLGFRAQD
jgi:hypothetical protein